jgi:hypothetical protein
MLKPKPWFLEKVFKQLSLLRKFDLLLVKIFFEFQVCNFKLRTKKWFMLVKKIFPEKYNSRSALTSADKDKFLENDLGINFSEFKSAWNKMTRNEKQQ